jgi:prepilin-type processing-associated H-X9-DG protein
LIEVLVVVAIIALLISILVPTLKQAKDQAMRTVCAAHMHQVMFGINSYANDNKGSGPYRGYKTYTVAEPPREALGGGAKPSKELDPKGSLGANAHALVALGLLWPKYVGREHNVLYCPAFKDVRDQKWTPPGDVGNAGGWKAAFVSWHDCYWVLGAYNYGNILAPKNADVTPVVPPRAPSLRGTNPYPMEGWSGGFTNWVSTVWQPANPGMVFRMPTVAVLVMDPWVGGYEPRHSNGKIVNVSYTDGHVRSHRIDKTVTSGGGAFEQERKWWYFTLRP